MLSQRVQANLVDGAPTRTEVDQALIKADSRVLCTSIIAKVIWTIMAEFEKVYPGYGFAKHKGY